MGSTTKIPVRKEYDRRPSKSRTDEPQITCTCMRQVFLLAPNLKSWRRMQLDNPSALRPSFTGDTPAPKLSRSHTPQGRQSVSPSRNGMSSHRSKEVLGQSSDSGAAFRTPRRQRRACGRIGGRAHHPSEPPCDIEADGEQLQQQEQEREASQVRPPARKLFLSPFGNAVQRYTTSSPICRAPISPNQEYTSWATSPGRKQRVLSGPEAQSPWDEAGVVGGGSRRNRLGGGGLQAGVRDAQQPKKSHAKLDLLLREVQRLNHRLDGIVGHVDETKGANRGDAIVDGCS